MRTDLFSLAALLALCPLASAATLPTSDGAIRTDNWGYQLQGPESADGELKPGPLAAAPHDLIVMDYARFGDEGSLFTPAEVSDIKQRAGGSGQRRVVASYVSIGEASDFRSYWDPAWTSNGKANGRLTASAPAFLGPVNPDFPESRKVRYWQDDWQALMFNDAGTGYIDTIVDQGFDAAYLDIIDAYFFWGKEVKASQQKPGDPTDVQDAARRMIRFVVDLTAHARQTNPDFYSIPQNGAFILNDSEFGGPLAADPALRAAYLDAIGAIGVEDVYFGGDADEDNPFNPDDDTIAILQEDFLANGKPVFAVDYLTDPTKAQRFTDEASADGFIPYVAPSRDLDVLGPPVPEPGTLTSVILGAMLLNRRKTRR